MWEGIEARLAENEREQEVPLRKSFLAVLRNSDVRPGQSATKKMVAFESGGHERLVWQIEGTAQHFYLHQKWQSRIEAAAFPTKPFPYQQGAKDGGRHSALSRDWAFGTAECFQVKLDGADALQELLDVLLPEANGLHLNPAAVTDGLSASASFFPTSSGSISPTLISMRASAIINWKWRRSCGRGLKAPQPTRKVSTRSTRL